MRKIVLLMCLAVAACDDEPVTRAQTDAHAKAYDACAHQARNGKELANCAWAVGEMH